MQNPAKYLLVVRKNHERTGGVLLVADWQELQIKISERLRVKLPVVLWDEHGTVLFSSSDLASLVPPHCIYVGKEGDIFRPAPPYKCRFCKSKKVRHTCIINPSNPLTLAPIWKLLGK